MLQLEWVKHTVNELKIELQERGLSTTGSKSELVTRLVGDSFAEHPSPEVEAPKVFSYDDRHEWGRLFIDAMSEFKGVECHLFDTFDEVPDTSNIFVYIHPDHTINREKDRIIIEGLQQHELASFMPSLQGLLVYDEKLRQSKLYADWIPQTWIFHDIESARKQLESMKFPFISKSNEGAASSNVRLLLSIQDAENELNQVFLGEGLPRYDSRKIGLVQKDYVLWQEFLSDNDYDWRVIMIDQRFAWVIKRNNRPDIPFASGSGLIENITKLDDEITEILNHSFDFISKYSLNFTGIDLIRDSEGNLKILESTTGWGAYAYFESKIFMKNEENKWVSTIFKGKDQWRIAALSMASIIQRSY